VHAYDENHHDEMPTDVLLTGVAGKHEFVINCGKDPDENALATKSAALIECFGTVSCLR
jgi:hypothetical protein